VLASKLSTNAKFARFKLKDFSGFSSTFKHLICFQALSRALKFLFQIQAFSRISQTRYEPCTGQSPTLACPASPLAACIQRIRYVDETNTIVRHDVSCRIEKLIYD